MRVNFYLHDEPSLVYSYHAPASDAKMSLIRRNIASAMNMRPDDLVLSFREQELRDADTLQSYNFSDGDSLKARIISRGNREGAELCMMAASLQCDQLTKALSLSYSPRNN
ncbi:hypothetical protein BGZ72_000169 [Mortierella alpina]|nr:hypothetical protein BGZ72_000169 [Mortierella alpina]